MAQDLRTQWLNHWDRALRRRAIALMRIFDRISQSRNRHLEEHYAEINHLRARLGQRVNDTAAKKSLCKEIDALIRKLAPHLEEVVPRRMVRLRHVGRHLGSQARKSEFIVGWEEAPPIVGKRYRVFKEKKGVFSTSIVRKVAAGFFQTENSVYYVDVLKENRPGDGQ